MKSIKILLLMFLPALVIFSCTERINIELDESYSRLVVDGSVTNENTFHSVILSKTSSYYFNQPPIMVTGAGVTVSDGVSTWFLVEVAPGVYRTATKMTGDPGRTYTLNIKLDTPVGGYSDYSASSVLYNTPVIDSLRLIFHPDWSKYGLCEVNAFLQEPEGNDYYRFMISRNSVLVTDTLYEWYVTDDRLLAGGYASGATIGMLDQGDPSQLIGKGDTVTAEINGITEEYADFITQAQEELRGSNPLFSGPRANIKGNISNGAIGFFSAYSVYRRSVINPK